MKIICVGQNYNDHNKEMGRESNSKSDDPVIFIKPDSAYLSTQRLNRFYIPDFTKNLHYETEIVVKINRLGKNIAERFAHRYYDEISVGLDLTARDIQEKLKEKRQPWEISKAFDYSAIVGKFIPKEQYDVNCLHFCMTLNDKKVQIGNTKNMIHSIDKIISYASQFFTLKIGDLIFTGTPAGVGQLNIGDKIHAYIEEEELLHLKIC